MIGSILENIQNSLLLAEIQWFVLADTTSFLSVFYFFDKLLLVKLYQFS